MVKIKAKSPLYSKETVAKVVTASKPKKSLTVQRDGWDNFFWRMERDGVTQSIIALFALCPQKAHYKMIEGLELKMKDRALEFGSFFHEALDKVYSQRMIGNPDDEEVLQELYETTKERLEDADVKDQQEFEINYGVCKVTLERYFQKWAKDKQNFIAIEQVFEFPYRLRDGTVIAIKGKFDGVFRDKKGKLWLFETKTKSQIDGNHIVQKMDFELQVMIYLMALKHVYGETPVGVLYNLIRRPQQRFSGTFQRKPEGVVDFIKRVDADIVSNMDKYFIRYPISVTQDAVETYKTTDLDYIIERLYEWQQGGISSFRNSNACSMWNRPCEYLPLCGSDDMFAKGRYSKRERVFPELDVIEE